jgi:hypothetical protein
VYASVDCENFGKRRQVGADAQALPAKKNPHRFRSGFVGSTANRSGCSWLILYLVTVFGFRVSLLDRFARDIHALDGFLLFVPTMLGFVLVTDALGHLISPELH